jgi:hypothetical protein
LGEPSGESDGGSAGWYSSGSVATTSTPSASREWMAGARIKIVLNGLDGFERPGIRTGASNDSS